MKNFVQPGNTITLTAPHAVASGDGLLVGSIFGIAAGAAALGEPVETALVGVSRRVSSSVTGFWMPMRMRST